MRIVQFLILGAFIAEGLMSINTLITVSEVKKEISWVKYEMGQIKQTQGDFNRQCIKVLEHNLEDLKIQNSCNKWVNDRLSELYDAVIIIGQMSENNHKQVMNQGVIKLR